MASDLKARKLIFLFCDEAWIRGAVTELIAYYRNMMPDAEMTELPISGAFVSLLDRPDSEESGHVLEQIEKISAGEEFVLVAIGHEKCGHNVCPKQDLSSRDFFRVIDMRNRLPSIFLDAFEKLRLLSVYTVEADGRARFLGRYF